MSGGSSLPRQCGYCNMNMIRNFDYHAMHKCKVSKDLIHYKTDEKRWKYWSIRGDYTEPEKYLHTYRKDNPAFRGNAHRGI